MDPTRVTGWRKEMTRWALVLSGILGAATAGCGDTSHAGDTPGPSTVEPASPGFSGGFASPAALGRAIIVGLSGRDEASLTALRVTEREYTELLWSQLPESRTMPLAAVWGLNDETSRVGLVAALSEYGGGGFEFIRLRFPRAPDVHSGFNLYSGVELWVRRMSDGQEGILPILDMVVEREGIWKLLNFVG